MRTLEQVQVAYILAPTHSAFQSRTYVISHNQNTPVNSSTRSHPRLPRAPARKRLPMQSLHDCRQTVIECSGGSQGKATGAGAGFTYNF